MESSYLRKIENKVDQTRLDKLEKIEAWYSGEYMRKAEVYLQCSAEAIKPPYCGDFSDRLE